MDSVLRRNDDTAVRWYVMRDLKRANALVPAYRMLQEMGIEVFTPMTWRLIQRHGKRVRCQVPFMQDLLFVHDMRRTLDPLVERTPTLQYRWVRNEYCTPMVVRDDDMQRFIQAVTASETVRYYKPGEITPEMLGRSVCIVGGPLDGCVGTLLSVRGSRTRRLIVQLPNLLTAGIEVSPEYIRFV